jgi:hypothetical protein
MKIYVANLMGFMGDGITAVGTTKKKAVDAVKKAYMKADKWRRAENARLGYPEEGRTNWKEAQDYHGLNVFEFKEGDALWMDVVSGGGSTI